MNFQQIEHFREAAGLILKEYGTDWNFRLLYCSENATFLAECASGRPEKTESEEMLQKEMPRVCFVLRISRPGYHSLSEIQAEMTWIQKIGEDTSLALARPVENWTGQVITEVQVQGQHFYGVLRPFLTGEHPGGSTGIPSEMEFEQAGETAAYLHDQVISWEGSTGLDRPVWDYEAMLGTGGLFGDWRVCQELSLEERGFLEQICQYIRNRLEHYPTDREHFGLIHADLRAANLLTEHGSMKILDFDDCGYGWFLYDLAASVSFLECEPQIEQWMQAWIRGYEKVRPFGAWEQEEMDTFVMIRRIQLLAWIVSHDDSDPVRYLYEGFAEGTIRLAETYWKKQENRLMHG